MSTTELVAPAQPWSAEASGRHRADPLLPVADRGELSIADQVVEKIAAAALAEVDQIGGAARRVLGVAVGAADSDARPLVDAQVNGSVVTVEARCSVGYPAPVGATTERARAHLIDRVAELTGLDVSRVDITVTTLTTTSESASSNRRELQ